MVFTPDEIEEQYIDILDNSTHGEIVLIRMTPTMLNKSIIDASHPLRLLLKENLDIDFKPMGRGIENGLKNEVELLINGQFETRTISYYRPKTKDGDPRFWISRLHNNINAFDMLLLTVWNNKLYAIPLIGDINKFSNALKEVFFINQDELPVSVLELQSYIQDIYKTGWIQTKKAGDTGVGYTFESLIGIEANSSQEPDYKGIEIKCSRGKSSTLQTLFSKIPNYGDLQNKRKDLVVNYGYWDSDKSRYALYMTIKALEENSQGWQLIFDYDTERIYVSKNGKKIVYYDYKVLKDSLALKHKQTVFIKVSSRNRNKKNDTNELFLYDSAYYCEESSFINFISLMEEGKISLDFAIHHDPETGKTRDHGFLWRIGKDYIPLLFKKQIKLCIKDEDC
jgi:hypothetical protein